MSKRFNIKPPTWPKEYTFQEFAKLNPHIINENQLITLYNQYLNKYLTELGEKKIHFKQSKVNQLLTELKDLKFDQIMSIATPGGGYQTKNYALQFTGDTDVTTRTYDYAYTDFNPNDHNLNLGFTVSYWVRPDAVGTHMFAFGRKYSDNERFTFGIDNKSRIYIGAGNVKMKCTWDTNCNSHPSGQTAAQLFPSLFDDDGDLEAGNWLHFTVTYADRDDTSSSATRKTYLNGELIQEANLNWNTTGGSWSTGHGDGMYFGGRNLRGSSNNGYNNGWACDLDEVAIYDTAKDANWVTSVYSGGTKYDHKNADNLVGYWKFNEGSGTTVKDHSGNGNHGTFAAISGDTTAFPTWKKR